MDVQTNLYVLSESAEYLFGDPECSQEGVPGWLSDGIMIGMVPVKVSDGLLQF